ncbi:permease [Terasakiella sp. SH-1]|uniref:permease n=1 Tax=Terasakiella sp. SH-1 TaxID=2560057 RepID=UPI0010743507|nr:permease [Terasakiella sp. SH-1]
MVTAVLKKSDFISRLDKVWLTLIISLALLFILDQAQFMPGVEFTVKSLWDIAPFILVSVLFAAYAKASGLDNQVARVFSGNPTQAIVLAAAFGALSPFCSCGVIPIIAGLLGAGVPLAPVLAFCIASPIMDPEMFVLMLGVFGMELTLVKTLSAFAMGAGGGFATHLFMKKGFFANPLKATTGCSSCSCTSTMSLKVEKVAWKFWQEDRRRKDWNDTFTATGYFLLKWLSLAFFFEGLMLTYVPADEIGQFLGNDAWWTVPLAVFVGIPTYLNGYAAIPTVSGLMELGMTPAAALGFMVGGGVTCIPAAIGMYGLLRKDVFILYLALGIGGALVASFAYWGYLSL